MKRKIAVITGTRAEYGLLYWIMKGIQESPKLELQLFVTGTHLSPEFGMTVKDVENQGFNINEKIEILLSSDTAVGIGKSVALATIGFAEAFARQKPDLAVMLGDRFEILAAAQAALLSRIPIAHIHGGETTEGAFDESIRHSVTKMSHLHFVAAEPYRRRVIQLGESPERVFNVGAPGIENIKKLRLLSLDELEKQIQFPLGSKYFLVTYHPETLGCKNPVESMCGLLNALEKFPDYKILLTYPNADTFGRELIKEINKYHAANEQRVYLTSSLGELRYLSAVKNSSLVIGNSSSGIIEAPSLNVPTVNVGNRQAGRLKADSVIDCSDNEDVIVSAIRVGLAYKGSFINPYGAGSTSSQIVRILENNGDLKLQKKFYDLDFEYQRVEV